MGKHDLITKDYALYVVHYFASMQTWSKEDILAEIDRKIKEADEDVVRCKDCKHYVYHEYYSMHLCENCNSPFHTSEFSTATKPNDFCSYGERKEK